MKEQLQKDIEWNRKQGYASDRTLTLQQKYERDKLMNEVIPDRPEANTVAQKEKHWSGSVGWDGVRGPKDEPDSKQVTIQYSTRPKVKEADDKKQQDIKRTPKYPEQIDQKEHEEVKDPEFPEDE